MTTVRTLNFAPGERNIFLHLLTACNLSCRHCYINRDMHGVGAVAGETIRHWLRLFFDPQKVNNCVFLGGEPTLHPELPQAIQWARQQGYASITVDTNGFLFHDFFKHVAPEEVDCLSFSLDGPDAAVNDPIRGKGVFEICTANLCQAVARGFATALIYTVNSRNIKQLRRMPELLARWGVDRFFIQVVGLRGRGAAGKGGDLQVGREEWLESVPLVAAEAAALGVETVYPPVFLGADEEFLCAGLHADNYFVFPNGRVYRCPLCEDYPVHALTVDGQGLHACDGLTEDRFFSLSIPEGCVMNKLLQPRTIEYNRHGTPRFKVACCLLKRFVK